MAGYTIDSTGLNNKAAQLTSQLWTTLRDLNELNAWLNDSNHTDVILTAAPYNISGTDLTVIRAAVADLGSANGLWGVAHAQKTVTAVNDFFFNAKKLTGTTWAG